MEGQIPFTGDAPSPTNTGLVEAVWPRSEAVGEMVSLETSWVLLAFNRWREERLPDIICCAEQQPAPHLLPQSVSWHHKKCQDKKTRLDIRNCTETLHPSSKSFWSNPEDGMMGCEGASQMASDKSPISFFICSTWLELRRHLHISSSPALCALPSSLLLAGQM